MADRRQQKERLRQERLAAESRAASGARRRAAMGYVVAGVLAVLVVAGIVAAVIAGDDDATGSSSELAHTDPSSGIIPPGLALDEREGAEPPAVQQADLQAAAKAAGCELRLDLPDEGNTHIGENADRPDYETNPPTSGPHSPEPLADGAYLETPEAINYVHSLEHGRIAIQYSPDLPESDQLALKGVFEEDPQGMILFPNDDMPYEVAVVSWTNMLACDSYDEATLDAVRAFRDTYRGQGPEAIPL